MHVIHDDACVKLQTKEQNPSDFLLSLISLHTSSKHGSVFFFFCFPFQGEGKVPARGK